MANVIGYFIDEEGIEYCVYDTDIDSTMGEFQARSYPRTNNVFDEDIATEDLNI